LADVNLAHVIRNWSTKQFNAVDNLSASIRWCLTGTPIQNNVGDLGSLIRFLRVPELSNATQFRKYISGIKPQDALFHRPNIPNLKLVLTSMCLRRSRDIISLPGITEEICEPSFTQQEKALYDGRVALLNQSLTKETNRGPKDKEFGSKPVLEAVLRLRIFCNVGLVGKLESDHLFSLLQQESDTNCRWCDVAVGTMDGDEMSERPRITHCYHIVCGECVPSVQKASHPSECPICSEKHEGDIFLDFAEREGDEHMGSQVKQAWPSKLVAVAQNLVEHVQAEKRFALSRHSSSITVFLAYIF
jgi:SWI/SNF-related matrix-associated actin-dependent regulator of chromatin subfamily A3